jgi:histidinol-phosphate/aromatic aminotransferase/cobyric acid decarboxylase-like protein
MSVDIAPFLWDDYFQIRSKYFSAKRRYFIPSSADANSIRALSELSDQYVANDEMISYQNDEAGMGLEVREAISCVLKAEGETFSTNEITISPSITSSSINVIHFLLSRGIKKIFLETPCYYATKFQIEAFAIDLHLIPTYRKNFFKWEIHEYNINDSAIWITQPRISLGMDQELEILLNLCNELHSKNSYLIIDEATELKVPSVLSNPAFVPFRSRIIRLRGLLKPFAINGPRISFALHGEDIAQDFKKFVWISHGGLDRFSVNTALEIGEKAAEYVAMKKRTHEQIFINYKNFRRCILHGQIQILPYENGYTSALILPFSNIPLSKKEYASKRNNLIRFIRDNDVFPTLGASMYFAYDGLNEYMRLNYLTNVDNLSIFLIKLNSFFRNNFCNT